MQTPLINRSIDVDVEIRVEPVTEVLAPSTPPTEQEIAQEENGEIETRLTSVALDQFAFSEGNSGETAFRQSTVEESSDELNEKILGLVQESGLLGEQPMGVQILEKEPMSVHDLQIRVLEERVESLQHQLKTQATEQAQELQGMQERLAATKEEKTKALAVAQALCIEQQTKLIKKIHALEAQVECLTSQLSVFQKLNTDVEEGNLELQMEAFSNKEPSVSSLLSTLRVQVNKDAQLEEEHLENRR